MKEIEIVSTENAPKAIGPYSQGIIANGFLFLSGQIPLDKDTNLIVGDSIEAQAEQVIKNINAILSSQGLGFESVVKTTCFLSDMADFSKFNSVYEKYFISKPARSLVAVKTLPKNVLVEIEVIALK